MFMPGKLILPVLVLTIMGGALAVRPHGFKARGDGLRSRRFALSSGRDSYRTGAFKDKSNPRTIQLQGVQKKFNSPPPTPLFGTGLKLGSVVPTKRAIQPKQKKSSLQLLRERMAKEKQSASPASVPAVKKPQGIQKPAGLTMIQAESIHNAEFKDDAPDARDVGDAAIMLDRLENLNM